MRNSRTAKGPRAVGAEPYRLATVQRACQLLKSFRDEGESLTLSDLAARTGLHKTIVFRLVHTLRAEGFLDPVQKHHYRPTFRMLHRPRYRLGYAMYTDRVVFGNVVSDSLRLAAAREQIDLIVVNNRNSAKVAYRNAERLVKAGVDLVFEYQGNYQAAPAVSARFVEAAIPLVAIEIPHPGATYYGANHYRAGVLAGRALGRWARRQWASRVDQVLMLKVPVLGPLLELRFSGMVEGLREVIPSLGSHAFCYRETQDDLGDTLDVVRKHLRFVPRQRTLIGTMNDSLALGALRAFEEAGRAEQCAVVGQGGSPEGRREMRRPGSRLIGSVAYFPERYGEELIRLATEILSRHPVPPALFVQHRLLTPANVDRYYPNDRLEEVISGQG